MVLPRLYPIVDTASLETLGLGPVDAAAAMLEGGVRILQFRHKGPYSRTVFAEAERVGELCREAGAVFVIDDRSDVARLLGAAVHLGQDDLPPALARKIVGSETMVGFSTHNEEQLRAAAEQPVDYLALGPIFGTASKENPDPVLGVDGLRQLRPLASHPLVAIGGITRENAWDVLGGGADSLAVIGDLMPAQLSRSSLRQRIEEWQTLLNRK